MRALDWLRCRALPLAAVLLLCAAAGHATGQSARSFSISTSRTFAPTEKPTIHVYAQNEDVLEFRIYHVNDPARFFASLDDLHSFGAGQPTGPAENIDQPTLLERFHDWKHHLWFLIRQFFRNQVSWHTRETLRHQQALLARREHIVSVTEFAQVPVLNASQMVARWRQTMPPNFVSDSQDLPIDPLPAGLYLVEATDAHYKAYTLLMVSQMVLVTRTGNGTALAYTADRRTGAPIADAQIVIGVGHQQVAGGQTEKDGTLDLKAISDMQGDNLWVLATRGSGDVAAVTPWSWSFTEGASDHYLCYTYTDRPIYRPGDAVHWKAILRQREQNHLKLPQVAKVHVRITDDENKAIFDKQLPLDSMGTVSGDLTLAPDADLGYYQISVAELGSGSFEVQDYRKPEYQVKVSTDKPRVLQGNKVQATIDSRYFFGEPVANAKVKYRVYHSTHYWWEDGDDDNSPDMDAGGGGDSGEYDQGYDGDQESEQVGRLDANGQLTITVPTQVDDKNHNDYDYTIEASVTDDANREITGNGHFLATYGSYRIHIEPASYLALPGQPAVLNITAVDYDNTPVTARVHVEANYWHYDGNGGRGTTTSLGAWDTVTDAQGKAQITEPVSLPGSGDVQFDATSVTPENRTVEDHAFVWMLTAQQAGSYGLEEFNSSAQLQIVADKKSYSPGDTAHLCLIAQTEGFYALVTATGNSLAYKQVLHSDSRSLNFDIPIDADAQPNLTVSAIVLSNGQLSRADKQIKVPPLEKQLQITITPSADIFQPEQTVSYDVSVTDWQKKPVSAELSFGAVDEAIYAIQPDSSGDIVKALYPERGGYFDVSSSLTYYFRGEAGLKSPLLTEHRRAFNPRMGQVKPSMDLVQPKVRKAFPDTAFWAPDIHTDLNGHARVQFAFPDSLTTWRATVRAVTADSEAGAAINRIIVRKNIIVRMGTPRFMRKGDEISLPVIVHNYLDQAKVVTVSLDVAGLDTLAGQTQQITVPSKSDATAHWRLKASQIGTATLTAKALTTQESDALEVSFPVEPVGVPQDLSASGVINESGTKQSVPINFPTDIDPSADSLQVEVAPSIAGSIFSALQYLTSFPYGCTEQTMSSFLPDVLVAQALKQVKSAGGVDPVVLRQQVSAGLSRLYDYQHDDGGWGWWKEDQSRVFLTAYVVSGMAQAQQAGYSVDGNRLQRGKNYLQSILAQHPNMLLGLRAYVTWALDQAGYVSADSVDMLWNNRSKLDNESLAMLGLVLDAQHDSREHDIVLRLELQAVQEPGFTHWESNYDSLMDFEYPDQVKATALALKFLVHADAQDPMLPKAAAWLVAHRNGGYWWDTTLQTAFALYGLTDYVAATHETDADFDAEIIVNGVSAGKRHFSSSDAAGGATLSITLNAAHLHPQQNTVQIVKHGRGRIYYSLLGKYFSTKRSLYQQGTMQFNLTRDYYRLVPVTTAAKTIEYDLQPLNGPVAVGDILAVHLAIAGTEEKYLMIEDPIPAGTEFLTHEESYNIRHRPDDWDWWYTRREFHDDHAAIFATDFDKRQDSFYLIQVVNPGSFSISPASAGPMYEPGVEATSDALHLEVTQ